MAKHYLIVSAIFPFGADGSIYWASVSHLMCVVASTAGLSAIVIKSMVVMLVLVLHAVNGNLTRASVLLLGWQILLHLCLTVAKMLVVVSAVVDSHVLWQYTRDLLGILHLFSKASYVNVRACSLK